jgi:polar amino acid transport system substrate-binding protein
MRRILVIAAVVVSTAFVAACGSTASTPAAVGGSAAGLLSAGSVLPQGAQPVDVSAVPASPDEYCEGRRTTASLAPSGPLPAPGQMPADTWMATIAQRPNGGYLNVGVDQNTLLWGYRNPGTGLLEGFDIDMVKQVAKAIFGPNFMSHLHFVIVPNADRQKDVSNGTVDLVAETMTITCGRQDGSDGPKVDFSSEYYDAHQEVLVPKESTINSLDDLSGKRVCAAQGSTSLATLKDRVPGVHLWEAPNETDCLVMLQQGQIDAISTDDTILDGFIAQDPNLQILVGQAGPFTLSDEPYGMAISAQHPDFVRFVNAVLAEENVDQTDGTWANLWRQDLKTPVVTFPEVPNRSS